MSQVKQAGIWQRVLLAGLDIHTQNLLRPRALLLRYTLVSPSVAGGGLKVPSGER